MYNMCSTKLLETNGWKSDCWVINLSYHNEVLVIVSAVKETGYICKGGNSAKNVTVIFVSIGLLLI